MKTFRDKYFKNKLDPKAFYYYCIRTCELIPLFNNVHKIVLLIVQDHFQSCRAIGI